MIDTSTPELDALIERMTRADAERIVRQAMQNAEQAVDESLRRNKIHAGFTLGLMLRPDLVDDVHKQLQEKAKSKLLNTIFG